MNIFSQIYLALLIVTLFSYLIVYEKKNRYSLMVILLMVLWLLTTIAAISLIKFAGLKNNLVVFHISTPLEYTIFALLYRNEISNSIVKKIILVSIPIFIALSFLVAAFIQPPDNNNSLMITIESVVIIIYSLIYLRELLLYQEVVDLRKYPMFWICIGTLAFFIGLLTIDGMLNYLVNQSMSNAIRLYRFGHVFKYLLFVLFIIGALCNKFRIREWILKR